MTVDLDRKRARDRERQRRLTAEGRRPSRAQLRQVQTPEQREKAAARQRRALQWRQVGREFERLMRPPADVLTVAVAKVNNDETRTT